MKCAKSTLDTLIDIEKCKKIIQEKRMAEKAKDDNGSVNDGI